MISPPLGEFERIASQVEEDLPQADRVSHQVPGKVRRKEKKNLQALLLGLDQNRVRKAVEDVVQVERDLLQGHPARLDLGKVQDVVDDPQQGFGRPIDPEQVIPLPVGQFTLQNQVAHAGNGVHRRTDLMAHVGQKLTFGAVGPVGLLFAGLERILHLLPLGTVPGGHHDTVHGPVLPVMGEQGDILVATTAGGKIGPFLKMDRRPRKAFIQRRLDSLEKSLPQDVGYRVVDDLLPRHAESLEIGVVDRPIDVTPIHEGHQVLGSRDHSGVLAQPFLSLAQAGNIPVDGMDDILATQGDQLNGNEYISNIPLFGFVKGLKIIPAMGIQFFYALPYLFRGFYNLIVRYPEFPKLFTGITQLPASSLVELNHLACFRVNDQNTVRRNIKQGMVLLFGPFQGVLHLLAFGYVTANPDQAVEFAIIGHERNLDCVINHFPAIIENRVFLKAGWLTAGKQNCVRCLIFTGFWFRKQFLHRSSQNLGLLQSNPFLECLVAPLEHAMTVLDENDVRYRINHLPQQGTFPGERLFHLAALGDVGMDRHDLPRIEPVDVVLPPAADPLVLIKGVGMRLRLPGAMNPPEDLEQAERLDPGKRLGHPAAQDPFFGNAVDPLGRLVEIPEDEIRPVVHRFVDRHAVPHGVEK